MSKTRENNGTPPTGHEWGERTVQSVSHRAPDYWESDAYEIRQCFGIPQFDPMAFEPEEGQIRSLVYPDLMVQESDPSVTTAPPGGKDCFFLGERGCGKTTSALNTAVRQMEQTQGVDEDNRGKVIWRGSPQRSGWLPFKHWTTVYLPKHAEVSVRWMDETDAPRGETDLEEIVRDVVYYESVLDLIDELAEQKPGTFNVVYPDPSFSGCEALTAETDRIADPLPFRPSWKTDEDESSTPLIDWWFVFLLARTEHGTHVGYTSLIFDEIGDFVPQDASNDGRRLYDKIDLLRSIWAESRRARLSQYYYGHYETDVHDKIRRQFKWRVQMPDESPNPKKKLRSTHPVGFKTVPMVTDLTSGLDVGQALAYNQTKFSYFSWSDIPGFEEDEDRWLQVRLSEPENLPLPEESENDADEAELVFDEQVFSQWRNQMDHRLYVKSPGEGYISISDATVGEELVSPFEWGEFDDLHRDGNLVEVRLRTGDDELVTVAKIPLSKTDGSAATQGGVGV